MEAEIREQALVYVRPDIDPGVAALYQEGVKLQEYAESRTIQSTEDLTAATNDLSVISKVKKAIEELRTTKYTKPLNDHLKTINTAFKEFVAPLETADTITRRKVLDYRAELERKRLEEERINHLREEAARAEMALKGEVTEPVNLVAVAPVAPTLHRAAGGTMGAANTWKFEVEDFSLLPDDYKVPDMVKIRKVVVAGATIPGVKAWQEEGLRITANG